jgi:nicotinamidase/pyrazinamidase
VTSATCTWRKPSSRTGGTVRYPNSSEEAALTDYDPLTALLVVDVQNDFADPSGGLSVGGGEEIVPVIDAEVAEALDSGALTVYTQDWHPPSTPHFKKDGGLWPVHCVAESWGAAFHPDLRVDARAPVVRKGFGTTDGYSAFSVRDAVSGDESATELERLLHDRGIERIVVCGLATDYCVVETATDARRLGHPVTVLTKAIRAVDLRPGDGELALTRMLDAGAELR